MACGYNQISGVVVTGKYAPVTNDVNGQFLLIVMLLKKYDEKLIEIEVAFLNGESEEEIYMQFPQVLEDAKEDECVKLLHAIYGLVKSLHQL